MRRLTIFLLALVLVRSLATSLDVPSGHPASGLGPDQTEPHIFRAAATNLVRNPKRRNRLRRQGAANSRAITFKLSYAINTALLSTAEDVKILEFLTAWVKGELLKWGLVS